MKDSIQWHANRKILIARILLPPLNQSNISAHAFRENSSSG